MQGGDVVTTWVAYPWHMWDYEHQEGFMGVGKKVGVLGASR